MITITQTGQANRFLSVISIVTLLFFLSINAGAQTNQTVVNGGATTAVTFPGTGCTYNWVNDTPGIGLAASGTGNIASFTAVNTGSSPVVATVTATPISGGLAYISNKGSNNVSVINTATNTVVATIPVGGNPFGVVVSKDGAWAYIANSTSSTISVINTATNTVERSIPVAQYSPYSIALSPDGSVAYTANTDNSVSVVKTATGEFIASINLATLGYNIAISPDGSLVYVTHNSGNLGISVINTANNRVATTIQLPVTPECITVSPDGSKLYVTSVGSNSVTVVDATTHAVIATVAVGKSPEGMSISSDGTLLYTANQKSNNVSVINTFTKQVVATIPVGAGPIGISLSPDGSLAYVSCGVAGTVSVIATSTNKVIATVPVGKTPDAQGSFVINSAGCMAVKFTITINPTPAPAPGITVTTAKGTIFSCAGTASASPAIQQFTVSGGNLTADIIAVAPAGFEVSIAPESGYGSSVTLKQSSGTINCSIVYVRSSGTAAAGHLSGNVRLTSGSSSQNVVVTATINKSVSVNTVGNQIVKNNQATAAINFTGTADTFTWTNDTPGIGLPASGTGNIATFTAKNTGTSPVTATITVKPAPVASAYIPLLISDVVAVINTTSNTSLSFIPVGHNPWGVAISPDGSRVYIGNRADGTVSVIETNTNEVIATIAMTDTPYGIVVSPDGTKVYVVNHYLGSVTVISAATNTVTSVLPGGENSLAITISPDGSRLYLANYTVSDASVTVVNTITGTVEAVIPMLQSPTDLVLSPDGGVLYVANSYSNTVTVVNTADNQVTSVIPVGLVPYGVTISPDGSRLYVGIAGSNNVLVINTLTNTITNTIAVGTDPLGMSRSSDGSLVFVVNQGSGDVSIINTASNAVMSTVTLSNGHFASNTVSSGNFVVPGTPCSMPVTFTITVNPTIAAGPPVITSTTATGIITACSGTSSTSPNIQQFTVSGNNLTADITATAPAGFEISLSPGSGYSTNITLSQSGGFVNNLVVYVRSAATAAIGNISGNVILSSAGVPNQTVAVAGIVNALPTVNAISNQTLTSGQSTSAVNFTGTANTYNWVNDTPGIGLPAGGSGNIAPFTVVNTGSAPVIATITVTPINSGYAYIANQASNDVSVVNTSASTVVATIPVGSGPLSSIISPDGSLVYAINSGSNNISVINTSTNTVTSTIPAGNTPFSGAVTPDGTRLYVANWGSDDVSVINTATHNIEAIVPVGLEPSLVAASSDGTKVYVTNFKSASVSVIDVASHTVVATVQVGNLPYGIVVSPDNSTVYVVNSSDLTISVIDAASNTVKSTIKSGAVNCIAISPDGKLLYVSNINAVAVIDAQTGVIVTSVQVPTEPFGISVSPDGSRAYVADAYSNSVSVINTLTNTLLPGIPVGDKPNSLGNFVGPNGCSGNSTTFTITVNPSANPIITTSGAVAAVTTTYGTPSASATFNVEGANLTGDILISSPPGFEASIDNITFSSNVVVGANGNVSPTTVYVRIPGTTAVGSYTGTVTLSSPGAPNVTVQVTATVTPAPLTITADNLNKTYGTALTGGGAGATSFTSTGLKNLETIGTITVTYGTGVAATDGAGAYTGSITASAATGGTFAAANYNIIYLPGDIIVAPASLTIIADNKTKVYLSDNPVLTAGYIGFVNNEGPAQLTTAPVLSTTAVTTSPVGQYSITARGAAAQNYNITYLPGILTVELVPATIVIPNTFTPNGDGINDSWTIKNIEFYANCNVEVYNRYGENVYSSIGYGIPWNGSYKGARLPTGTYYYIIDLKNKNKVLSGFVAIIR